MNAEPNQPTWLHAGASGYSFKEWRGPFYPAELPADRMLDFYAQHLNTVEINNTFYRMPSRDVVANWAQCTPPNFRFAVKASRRITHDGRLHADKVADSVAYLYRQLEAMGDKLAAVLFQLPPNLKADLPRLRDFVAGLPPNHRAAFEFRNESWFDDATYAALRDAGAALVLSEREDALPPLLVETTSWAYLRLRLEQYADADLAAWADRLARSGWREVYAYFMHEPTAPGCAQRLTRLAAPLPRP